MTTCVISQPRFFPGLHYLHRMMVADIFVILDSVQYSPRHEENRTKLKAQNGAQWLTVPMVQASREQRILDTAVDTARPWQHKALGTIAALYGKAPRYREHSETVTSIIEAGHETLTDLDRASWEPAIQLLDISCMFVRSSDLPVSSNGSQLLLDICQYLGADEYLSGGFGREYLDIDHFTAAGVQVRFHDYQYPVYQQRFGDFVPFLSYLDMLFNVGLDRAAVQAGGASLAVAAPEAPASTEMLGGKE